LFHRLTPFQRSLVSALFGLAGYGAWAYIANSAHEFRVALKAACVQGGYSFLLTFIMTMLIEQIYSKFSHMAYRYGAVATVILVCLGLYTSSWAINYIAQTPEILMTVLPGYIIGTGYTATYVYKLSNSRSSRNSQIKEAL
jgi:hypothetical protein